MSGFHPDIKGMVEVSQKELRATNIPVQLLFTPAPTCDRAATERYIWKTRSKDGETHGWGMGKVLVKGPKTSKTFLSNVQQTGTGDRFGQQNIANLLLSSVTQSCLTLCDPMDHSMPGLPVFH